MDRRAGTSMLVLIISVLLALAGPVAAGMKARFAAGVGVLPRLMTTRLEDSVAPELTVDVELHRRVLADSYVASRALNADQPACIRSCPAHGRPYSGRPCSPVYQCSSRPAGLAV